MEPDRFEQSHAYFITGIVCLLISLSFFGLSLYMLPYLIFNLHYSLPELMVDLFGYMLSNYQVSSTAATWIVFLMFLSVAIISAIIAYIASNHIDNKIHKVEVEEEEKPQDWNKLKQGTKDSGRFLFKIIMIVGFVFVISMLFQWVISAPTPSQY